MTTDNTTSIPQPCEDSLAASPTVTLQCQGVAGHEGLHTFSGDVNGKRVDAHWTTDKGYHSITQGPIPVPGSPA